jgi:CBS domain-containing protein
MLCPSCGSDNTEGADLCQQCQLSLTDMSRPKPHSQVERDLLKDHIDILHPRQPIRVAPETAVSDALNRMMAGSQGCVMVVDGDKVVGIFTERDALLKLHFDAGRIANEPVSSVMTANPIMLEATNKIAFALHKMDVGGYRHVPILTAGKLTGIISIRDILGYLTQRIKSEKTGE